MYLFNMPKNSEPSALEPGPTHMEVEVEKVLIQQTQWIAERYELINEGLMTRASSLAGFAGVELSLVAQMVVSLNRSTPSHHWSHKFTTFVYILVALTVFSLLTSIWLFIRALTAKSSATLPNHGSIVALYAYIEEHKIEMDRAHGLKLRKPMEQLLMRHAPDKSYLAYLTEENRDRGEKYVCGTHALIASQVLLVALVLVIFWR